MVIRLILNVEWGRKLVRQKTEEAGKRRGRFEKEIGTKGATGQQFWGGQRLSTNCKVAVGGNTYARRRQASTSRHSRYIITDDGDDRRMPKEGGEAVREGHREKSTSRRRFGNGRDRNGNQETGEEERLGGAGVHLKD
jgi:hypothetical protein